MKKTILSILLLISGYSWAEETTPQAPIENTQSTQISTPMRKNFSVYGFYNFSDNPKFNNVSSSSGFTGTADSKVDQAFGIGFESVKYFSESWSMTGGITYESARKVKSTTTTSSSGVVGSITAGSAEFNFLTLYANAIYNRPSFYIPFGLNAMRPIVKNGSTSNIETQMGMGFQAGIGKEFADDFGVEFLIKSSSFKAFETFNSGGYNDYGTGVMVGSQINFKYNF